MKKKITPIYLFFILNSLISCNQKTYFKEVVSEKNVTLFKPEFSKTSEDLIISIPVEFNLYLNNFPEIKDVGIYYKKNGKRCEQIDDFVLRDGKTNKIIFAIEDLESPNYPESIYIVDRKMTIPKEKAQEMIKRYNITTSLKNIKSKNDTIKLVSYLKFKKDYPDFINELRKVPDSLVLSLGLSKGKSKVVKAKINW